MLGSLLAVIPQPGDPFTSFDGMVIIIGISLVLAILVLLTLIILGEGKIFKSIDRRKKGAKKEPAPQKAEKAAAPSASTGSSAPYIEPGVPPQVIAAIAAAVASMEDGKFELRSVTRAKGAQSAWNMAGTVSNTEPF
ncbi:MAG: OadG family transporter subunit [Oscillospiraceae bacterium]|nr:OadG family transporter subunit [Oscillospiraceae bacterium]